MIVMTLPTTRDRVPVNTAEEVNRQIDQQIEDRVRAALANPAEIAPRLRQLAAEWDIERAIEMNASALAFIGRERQALKAVRGDYAAVAASQEPARAAVQAASS